METSKTVSICTAETEEVTHVVDIFGYSKHRGMGRNKFIRSGTFAVGGTDWGIRFYPDGLNKINKEDHGYISVYLELLSKPAKVRASCDLRLVDPSTGLSSSVHKTESRVFDSAVHLSRFAPHKNLFKKRSEVESSAYLRDDHLAIECIVTVIKEPQVTETRSFPKIEVPPSDITEHLGKMLKEKKGCDVTFRVGGETFAAHKCVLAMRSPVFMAELYGPMSEGRTRRRLTVSDMQPAIFRALLHFIYTDSLPGMELEEVKNTEMIRHLLVAADRYAMERLKLVCQSILGKNLNVGTVATTMALADQHNCDRLKHACLEFITCSNTMDAVVATQGYKNLKLTCPLVLVDALEKAREPSDCQIDHADLNMGMTRSMISLILKLYYQRASFPRSDCPKMNL